LLRGRPGRGAGRRVPEEGARGGAEAAMGRFRGTFRKNWAKWRLAYRGPLGLPGAPNGPKPTPMCLCGQLGPTRSRQDESKEVGEVGSKRTSSGCNGVHHVWWDGLISRLLPLPTEVPPVQPSSGSASKCRSCCWPLSTSPPTTLPSAPTCPSAPVSPHRLAN
jgi:hypothetical protein